jgi:BirA family biotin operon repressor/biotin-[acetyl-CoA-carboxylase] ligase
LADPGFRPERFAIRLPGEWRGHPLLVRHETGSTNDDALEALAAGARDFVTVVADRQLRGRGRAGRTWIHVPGPGLAMSLAFRADEDAARIGLLPLVAGLSVQRAAQAVGVRAAVLKWPNDVLIRGRKVAGVLCELRRLPGGGSAAVVGVGVNVQHAESDFPVELAGSATSLRIEGAITVVEDVAVAVLLSFVSLWRQVRAGGGQRVLDSWRESAAFWGETVTVRTPGGPVTGVAQRLDEGGGLVLRLEGGVETTVLAGDLEAGSAEGCAR